MQPHYCFRGVKPKLELFLKLAIPFFLAHFFPLSKGGGNLVVMRTWVAEKWAFFTAFLDEVRRVIWLGFRAPPSMCCLWLLGAVAGGFDLKMVCSFVSHAYRFQGVYTLNIPFLPLSAFLSL